MWRNIRASAAAGMHFDATRRTQLRRNLSTLAISLLLLASGYFTTGVAAQSSDTGRLPIITLDWTIAETLIAIGAPPDAAGELRSYDEWVGVPAMPETVLDLGMRAQPNLELLQRLSPAQIINSDMFIALNPMLEPFGEVSIVTLYPPNVGIWDSAVETALALGKLVGASKRAQALVDQSARDMMTDRARLAGIQKNKIAVVQLIDHRRVRVYGQRSIFNGGIEQLGLENAWPRDGNRWGFEEVGIDELAQLDSETVLVIVKPYPSGTLNLLERSRIWSALPVVRHGKVIIMDAVWGFGGIMSIKRFSGLLTQALIGAAGVTPAAANTDDY